MIALNEIEQQTLLLHLFMHLFIWVGHEPVLANHHRLDLAPQSPRRDLRKTAFLRHLYIKTIILPRQAQDKHRENSKKDAVFRTRHAVVVKPRRDGRHVVLQAGG